MKKEKIVLGAISITIAAIIITCALLPAFFSPAAEAAIFNVLPITVISGFVMIGLYIFIDRKEKGGLNECE